MSQPTALVPTPTASELSTVHPQRVRRVNLASVGTITILFVFTLYFLIPIFWRNFKSLLVICLEDTTAAS